MGYVKEVNNSFPQLFIALIKESDRMLILIEKVDKMLTVLSI
jgi:hypothetical protein